MERNRPSHPWAWYGDSVSDPVNSVEDVRERLARHGDLLSQFGVAAVAVFGSIARAEATANSDVDLLVTFDKPAGTFSVIRLERELACILGRRAEVVTPAALKPRLRDRIVAESVRAA